MKPLLGWEAGDRQELCNLLHWRARWADGQVRAGLRDPGLIHEMMELGLNLEALK